MVKEKKTKKKPKAKGQWEQPLTPMQIVELEDLMMGILPPTHPIQYLTPQEIAISRDLDRIQGGRSENEAAIALLGLRNTRNNMYFNS